MTTDKLKVLGLIPARGGSKGVPGKNIKKLGGKPLLAYTAEKALASERLTKVILSSDDEEIMEVAREFGVEVPFQRPAHLATDKSGSLGVVQHAIEFMEKQGEFFDAVCLLQATSPFRKEGFIDEAIAHFERNAYDSLVSVLEVPHEFNPHWVFEPNANGQLRIATGEKEIIKRRQELPQAYFRDGSIYLANTELIKQGSLLGERLGYIKNDTENYVNIDTLADWKKAEQKVIKYG